MSGEVVVGKPFKSDRIRDKRYVRIDWLSILSEIPVGFAVELTKSVGVVKAGIDRLVADKKIGADEFTVTSRREKVEGAEKAEIKVYIIHNKLE